MSRHPEPRGRDVVGFLAIFCAIGIVADVVWRDWARVSAWLSANVWAVYVIVVVCALAVLLLAWGTAVRSRQP